MSTRFSNEDEDETYGEDDFEQEEMEINRSHKSPLKKPGTPKLSLSEALKQELECIVAEEGSNGYNVSGAVNNAPAEDCEQQMEGEDFDDGDLDLEKYMSNMAFTSAGEADKGIDKTPAIFQPLDGFQPSETDFDQTSLREKLGYAIQTAQNISSLEIKYRESKSATSGENAKRFNEVNDNGMDEATKVDNLLMELFPERYSSNVSKKKTIEKSKKDKSKPIGTQYGLAVAPPRLTKEDREDDEGERDVQPKDVLSTLESQLKLLKKDLKVKDDKIMKLTDHSTMLANQLDRYKGEVARLNAKLHEMNMELEAKDSRLADVLRAKKKGKKASQSNIPIQENTNNSNLESEISRLRDREQALLDAVEELSSQNEDLIIKLRESMQRELELSSKRAALVNHTIARTENHVLPSIHEKESGSGAQSHRSVGSDHGYREHERSQSEPSIDVPQKRGKKKKKATMF